MVVTLVCVTLGITSRIAYLRACAEFHKREAQRVHWHVWIVREETQNHRDLIGRNLGLKEQFEAAVYRPWRFVDYTREPQPSSGTIGESKRPDEWAGVEESMRKEWNGMTEAQREQEFRRLFWNPPTSQAPAPKPPNSQAGPDNDP